MDESGTGREGGGPPLMEAVSSLGVGEAVERYARGTVGLDRRVLDLSDEEVDTFFREEAGVGRWSCRVLLGHLADAEVSFVHRMRRTVGESNPMLSAWDENGFIDEGVYRPSESVLLPVAGSVAVIHTLRLWMSEWLRALPGEAWERRALHPEAGEQRLRDQLDKAAWHLEHHAWFLERKLSLMRPSQG